jgi:hypothetical protein
VPEETREPSEGWTVARHLEGKPAFAVQLFERFVGLVSACGPFTFSPTKTTISFKGTRRGFAGARPTARGIVCYLDLQRVVTDSRVTSAAPYTSRLFVHHLTLTSLDQLDDELAGWIAEAYAVGAGAHVMARPRGSSSSPRPPLAARG